MFKICRSTRRVLRIILCLLVIAGDSVKSDRVFPIYSLETSVSTLLKISVLCLVKAKINQGSNPDVTKMQYESFLPQSYKKTTNSVSRGPNDIEIV